MIRLSAQVSCCEREENVVSLQVLRVLIRPEASSITIVNHTCIAAASTVRVTTAIAMAAITTSSDRAVLPLKQSVCHAAKLGVPSLGEAFVLAFDNIA